MKGNRESFVCPSCAKSFTYWVQEGNPHPKVKCYFCGKDAFPKGEPPPAPPAEAPTAIQATNPAAPTSTT